MRFVHKIMVPAAIIIFVASACTRKPSEEALLRESVTAGKVAQGNDQWYVFQETAIVQAEHGHYADAFDTARLVNQYRDQLFAQLVAIRAKNGDILGAKSMAAWAPDWKARADEAISIVQASAGDIKGARDTSQGLADKSNVLWAIGEHQVESGDIEGALKTAAEMKWSDGLLFAIVEKLREQGANEHAHEIALRITDRDMARNAEAVSVGRPDGPTDACELALRDAGAGRYTDAYAKLRARNCDCKTVASIHEEANDADGAERAVRGCLGPADISVEFAALATRSAARGDISGALRFADKVRISDGPFVEGYLAEALRDIGRGWGKKEGPQSAVRWARLRPDGFQRAMALLGVAESVSLTRGRR
jgi:hypothetical protein